MSKKQRIAIVLGCTLAGLLVAEGGLLLLALVRFGIHTPEPFRKFIAETCPMTGVGGACFGFFSGRAIGRGVQT
jgi:hypothetical protein